MPIRVLAVGNVYPPHHLGGYELIWRGVMQRLRERGDAIRILTTDYRRPEATGTPDDPDVHRELDWYWREHRWRSLGWRERLELERRNASTLDRHLAEFAPDVITWWPVGGISLGLLERARRAGVPAVLFVLDYWPVYGPQHDLWIKGWSRLGPLRRVGERLTGLPTHVELASLGEWVFCSNAAREETARAGVRPSRSAVIAPGVQEAYLKAPREQRPPPWEWRLLYAGRVVEQKGVATAIEALAMLPQSATLRIVGEGDPGYRAMLEALAARLGVTHRVRFDPPVSPERLIDVYRGADVVLFPVQWTEPWGLVPLEAMALGRPVVATGRGGSGDYLRDQDNALLFKAGSAESLAAAVQRLAADERLQEHLRESGYRTAAAHSEDTFNRRAYDSIHEAARTRA